MKKLSLYLFLVLIFSFNINASAWKTVPVPHSVDKNTKSPWNFFDNFEDKQFNKYIISDKGAGGKPYKFKKESDGNTYMEVTVKHGWNKCCSDSPSNTERAEFSPKRKKTIGKEIWYGFKLRFPKDFKHIDDRILITQFKNQFVPMKKSPLFSIHYRHLGNEIDFGGHTGGIAGTYWNTKENIVNSVNVRYWKEKKDNKWWLSKLKKRNSSFNSTVMCKLLENNPTKIPNYCNDEMINYDKTSNRSNCDTIIYGNCYKDGKLVPKNKDNELIIDKSNTIKGVKSFNATNLGEWTTYKIGIRNSKKEDGFVKVYKDNQLIMDYQGITFKWKGNHVGTIIRLGPYRDSDPYGKGYPPQSIHYDDFTIVSDKKTLDKYLN
jgi:hypothetical protein